MNHLMASECDIHQCSTNLCNTSTVLTSTILAITILNITILTIVMLTSTLLTSTILTSTILTSTIFTSTILTSTILGVQWLTSASICTVDFCSQFVGLVFLLFGSQDLNAIFLWCVRDWVVTTWFFVFFQLRSDALLPLNKCVSPYFIAIHFLVSSTFEIN